MPSLKKPISLRLSEEIIKELNEIAKHQNISQSDVVTILIHLYCKNGNIENIDEWFEFARRS